MQMRVVRPSSIVGWVKTIVASLVILIFFKAMPDSLGIIYYDLVWWAWKMPNPALTRVAWLSQQHYLWCLFTPSMLAKTSHLLPAPSINTAQRWSSLHHNSYQSCPETSSVCLQYLQRNPLSTHHVFFNVTPFLQNLLLWWQISKKSLIEIPQVSKEAHHTAPTKWIKNSPPRPPHAKSLAISLLSSPPIKMRRSFS